MKFIKNTFLSIFSKKIKKDLGLTNEQKRRYSNQFIKIMLANFLVLLGLIWGLTNCIDLFFTQDVFRGTFLALGILIFKAIVDTLVDAKEDLDLVEERIDRRVRKNRRKGLSKSD